MMAIGGLLLGSEDAAATFPVAAAFAAPPSPVYNPRDGAGMGGLYRYVVTSASLVRSRDGGVTWTAIGEPSATELLGVEPQQGLEVLGLRSGVVWHSRDAGVTGTMIGAPPSGAYRGGAVDWAARRMHVIALDSSVASRSIESTAQWVIGPAQSTVVAASNGHVIAATFPSGLWHSPDGGTTWNRAVGVEERNYGAVAFSPSHPNVAFAIERFQGKFNPYSVYRSDDGGATWSSVGEIADGMQVAEQSFAVGPGLPATLLLTSGEGVWRSIDGGAAWSLLPRASGLSAVEARGVVFDAADPHKRWVRSPSSLVRTTDDGATWEPVASSGSKPVEVIGASATRSGLVFGVGQPTLGDSVLMRSLNGGSSWTTVLPFVSFTQPFSGLLPGVDGNEWFAVSNKANADGSSTLWRSVDEGATWGAASAPPTPIWWMARSAGASFALYAVAEDRTQKNLLYRSGDHGATWQALPRTGLEGQIWSIFVAPSQPSRWYVGTTVDSNYRDEIFRSDDAGASWTPIWRAMPNMFIAGLAIDPANSARVAVATGGPNPYWKGNGVYWSDDAGTSWSTLDDGLTQRRVNDVAFDPMRPGMLYASTISGPFRTDLAAGRPAGTRTAVEFHHARFDHYFVSADADEIAALNAGVFEGWAPTRDFFRVGASSDPGAFPTCRFFGVGFAPLSSHVYTPYPLECESLEHDPNWTFEKVAFGLVLPTAEGSCTLGTAPLYRAWNRNADGAPNHRYTTSYGKLDAMLNDGWILEGDAATKVFACVPH